MELKDIETILRRERIKLYSWKQNQYPKEAQRAIVNRIENGQLYAIKSLISYANSLDFDLMIDDYLIKDSLSLGSCLQNIRKSLGLKQSDCVMLMGLNRIRIYNLESRGKGNRNSLEKYLIGLKIEFKLFKRKQ